MGARLEIMLGAYYQNKARKEWLAEQKEERKKAAEPIPIFECVKHRLRRL